VNQQYDLAEAKFASADVLLATTLWGRSTTESNKGMKLTKLSAAWLPGWTCRLMPALAISDAGTASQLIPGVGPTMQ
jgi:hypothetical protein